MSGPGLAMSVRLARAGLHAAHSLQPVLWLLEEIGEPYELTEIAGVQRRSAEHLHRHPLGRVPALELGDGTTMFESAAICLHVADLNPAAGLIAWLDQANECLSISGSCSRWPNAKPRYFGGEPCLRSPEPSDLTGRGLLIVDALASAWGVEYRGTPGKTVWFAIT